MIIYKATNRANHKIYIGLTHDLQKRQQGHLDDVARGSQTHFHRAIRKHGLDAFDWVILAECETREEAGDLETKYIAEHNTFIDGYNSTTGGESGWTVTDEIRKKNSEAHLGKKHSIETKCKQSKANKGRIPWNRGKSYKLKSLKNHKMIKKKMIKDLDNLITTNAVEIGKVDKRAAHNEAISEAKKKYYASADGLVLRKSKSEKMKAFWASPEGEKRREIHAKKCGRKQTKKVSREEREIIAKRYEDGELLSELARDYGVDRSTIKRYIFAIKK